MQNGQYECLPTCLYGGIQKKATMLMCIHTKPVTMLHLPGALAKWKVRLPTYVQLGMISY